MFLAAVLAALVIVSSIYLLQQFWHRSLDGAAGASDAPRTESDPSHDALKAA